MLLLVNMVIGNVLFGFEGVLVMLSCCTYVVVNVMNYF